MLYYHSHQNSDPVQQIAVNAYTELMEGFPISQVPVRIDTVYDEDGEKVYDHLFGKLYGIGIKNNNVEDPIITLFLNTGHQIQVL